MWECNAVEGRARRKESGIAGEASTEEDDKKHGQREKRVTSGSIVKETARYKDRSFRERQKM